MIPLAARRRAMLAASTVETTSLREAAIVGAITRCVISCGRINTPWCSQYTADIIAEFRLRGVDATPPNLTELAGVIEQFQASYRQPFPG